MTTTTNESNDNESSSSSLLYVASCQFHVTDDKILNQQTASQFIDDAVQKMTQLSSSSGSDSSMASHSMIVVLPEIWNSPYATLAFPDYAEIVPHVGTMKIDPKISSSSYLLQQKAIEKSIYIVGGSIPEKVLHHDHDDKFDYYNTCVVYDPHGNIIAKHRKVHLFDIDIPNGITFKESDTLQPGHDVTYFTVNGINIGIGICYDIRFSVYATLLCQTYDCKCLIYPGAFNMVTGPAHWELLQRSRAVDNQCYVVTASPARSSVSSDDVSTPKKYPPYTAWGHSTVVNPWGEVIATCDENPNIIISSLDLMALQKIRQSIPITYQRRSDIYEIIETKKKS